MSCPGGVFIRQVHAARIRFLSFVCRRISPKPPSLTAQRPRSRTWKRAGRIFVRGKRVCTHHMHTSTHRPPTGLPWDGVPGGGLVDSKVRALGPHVAVRDSPYPVAHPHCLAGFEGRDRERHRREQEPSRLRCVLQMGWLGTSRGRRRVVLSFGGGAMTLVVCFTRVLVATTPHHLLWPTAYLWEFDGSKPSRLSLEAFRSEIFFWGGGLRRAYGWPIGLLRFSS